MTDPQRARARQSTKRLILALCSTIAITFVLATLSQLLVSGQPLRSALTVALVDSTLLSILALPALYFLVIVPLARHVARREQAERALAESEVHLRQADEKYRDIFEHALEGIYQTKPDGTFITANNAMARILGHESAEELMAQLTDHLGWGYADPVGRAEFRRLVEREGVVRGLEYEVLRRDGSRRWVSDNARAVRNAEGIIQYYEGTLTDITERRQLEGELRETEDRYRIAAESVSDVIVTIDQDSRIILFANNAVEKVFGYSSSELLGKELTALMPERYRDPHRAAVKRYAQTNTKHLNWNATDVIGLRKSGEEIVLEASYGEYVNGQQRYFVGVLRDVTESRLAADALKLFRALIDRSNDGIEVVDPGTGRLLDVNAKGCLDLGYSREELLALSVFDIDSTIDRSSFTRGMETLRNSGVLMQESLHRRKNGSTFPVEVNISLVQLDREYVVTVVRDITERKRAGDELRESAARLRLAVDGGGVGLWEWQVTTGQLTWNDQLRNIFGQPSDVTELTLDKFLGAIHPEDRAEMDGAIRQALQNHTGCSCEHRIVRPDGTCRWILFTGRAEYAADGVPVRMRGAALDVTERAQLQAQFRQAQKMDSVGQLASGIAHDFNNLLTVINGMSDLVLAQVSQDNPVHTDVQEIRHAGERAATLTRQLLAFSRQQILEPRVLNVNTVVSGTEGLLRRLLGEDIDLVIVLTPDLGRVKVDPGQIEQVITNLAVNARDAMPQGGKLTIETQNVEVDEDYARQHEIAVTPGSYVLLAVSDAGVGMDNATRSRVFEPFFTTKGPGKGTGLGLSTVFGIVKQSRGFIWVYSEVGHGTSFKILLPRVTEAADLDRPAPTVVSSSGTETILLVEDNAALRKLATRVLEPAGYTVLGAAEGTEALRLLEGHEEPVHLLLSDVVMPGMDGRKLAEQLAQTRPRMKVLFMSGYTGDTIVRHGVLDAQVPFLNKPFTAAALLRKVREVLDS